MYIAIGKITQTHGLQGYVKAIPFSELPDRFLGLKTVYLDKGFGMQGFLVEDVKVQNTVSLLKLNGIDTREDASELVSQELWVPDDQKIELPENTYFIHELIGLAVFDIDGNPLGQITGVMSNAGNDVYVVNGLKGEILIPAVTEFIKSIDLPEGIMVVQLIDGMVE